MQAKIGATDQRPQQPDRQGSTKLDAGVAQALRLGALPPRASAERIDQQAALHAATSGANESFKDLVRRPAFVPDVEFNQDTGLRHIDITGDRREDRLGIGEELKSIAANGGAADQRTTQPVHRLRCRRKALPVDRGEIRRDGGFGDLPEIGAQGIDAARTLASDPTLADQQIDERAGIGQRRHQQQP